MTQTGSFDLPPPPQPLSVRRLCVVLGDQLDRNSSLLDGFDPTTDLLLMTEAWEEASYIPQHKKRLALFFAAMRHFACDMAAAGRPLIYHRLDAADAPQCLAAALRRAIQTLSPASVEVVLPGDWRVLDALRAACRDAGRELTVLPDRHFFVEPSDFAARRAGRKRFILEDFYRQERRRSDILMDGQDPVGGQWNYDSDNRKSFGRDGPGLLPSRATFAPDGVTREVLSLVAARFPDAPGRLEPFEEPVTPAQARAALADFVDHRLAMFGDYQDAIATGHVTLYHSRISAALNLKLLDPRDAIAAAAAAFEEGRAPLNAVEGFIRQILGWREFVRGVYWELMPGYAERNELGADRAVPGFFWTGETDMACLADGLGGLVETGYAHHIQRLMVMGLFLMLYGATPYRAHEWHVSMYLDAIDWVSLPNVLGMSQHGDGGVVGTKPYAASGAYIQRMSDCCRGCRYDPKQASGDAACPFTTLYWDFLARHEERLRGNRRMHMQLRNLDRKAPEELREIRAAADVLAARIETRG